MSTSYRHSQPGYLLIIVSLILIGAGAIVYAFGARPGGILCVIGICCLVFGYKLTVEIGDGSLSFWFGPGVFWKKVPLERIMYCQPFKGIICGWGIRITPDGWLYNVSGMKAVTIVLKSGKKIHIGTDEPHQLVEAVNSAIRGFGAGESSPMWTEVKTDYLKRVEEALSAARHPKSFEILADVAGHLDRRLAELGTQQQTWDNFQKIVTEMGPTSDYADLIGREQNQTIKIPSAGYIIALVLILIAVTAGMVALPKLLKKNKITPTKQPDSQTQHEQTIASAIEAAKSWLQLTDEGAYSQSWEQTAQFFRKYVSQDQWRISLEAVRKPLGKVLSRKIINSTYSTSLPGAPDGQYVVIQFETSFENKHSAVETVTPMLEPNGRWRVSGYYIK